MQKPEAVAEKSQLGSGVRPTHQCDMCGHVGFEDPVVGCLRCGWDEMRPLASTREESREEAE